MSTADSDHTRALRLGFSTCPNDTFIFYALAHGEVEGGLFGPGGPEVVLADVEELNRLAMAGAIDVCKVSAAAWPLLREDYALLASGGAMGHGVGPVLVADGKRTLPTPLASVAIPGQHTTAARLLRLFSQKHQELVDCEGLRPAIRFDRIARAILRGDVQAGVLIHEGRFTYKTHGLQLVQDLGQWWEQHYSLPLPLGIIVARRSLGAERITRIDAALRSSLNLAHGAPERVMPYVRQHAQELGEEAIRQHIETFVTPWSLDMGDEGRKAMALLTEA